MHYKMITGVKHSMGKKMNSDVVSSYGDGW